MTLQQFLNQNPVDGIIKEIIVSDRFRDENGNIMKFKIRAMTLSQLEDIKNKASFLNKKDNMSVNEDLFNSLIVIENTVEPSFKDAESLKAMGCSSPKQYLNRVLLAGEVSVISDAVISLSGFDRTIEDLAEDVKN